MTMRGAVMINDAKSRTIYQAREGSDAELAGQKLVQSMEEG